MDFTILYFGTVGIAAIMMIILNIALVLFGTLIEGTPDGRELRGEAVSSGNSFSSPKNASRIYALLLSIIFIVGGAIVLFANGSTIMMILGGVMMFAALLFGTTIVVFELIIYNTMKSHMNAIKTSVV